MWIRGEPIGKAWTGTDHGVLKGFRESRVTKEEGRRTA